MNKKKEKELTSMLKSHVNSDEFKALVQEQHENMKAELKIVEEASWFGSTGLSEEVERELPQYLRREFGESLLDEGSLKADELVYIGSFEIAEGGNVHFWRIPSGEQELFASVNVASDGGTTLDWGHEKPPN